MTRPEQLRIGCQIAWLKSKGLRWKEVALIIENEVGRRYCISRLKQLVSAAKRNGYSHLHDSDTASAA